TDDVDALVGEPAGDRAAIQAAGRRERNGLALQVLHAHRCETSRWVNPPVAQPPAAAEHQVLRRFYGCDGIPVSATTATGAGFLGSGWYNSQQSRERGSGSFQARSRGGVSAMRIRGAEDLTAAELAQELAAGGRVVFYEFCVSLVFLTLRSPSPLWLVRAG